MTDIDMADPGTPAAILGRAAELFLLADQELTGALSGPSAQQWVGLDRARATAAVAAAGARVAHAMTGAEHVAWAIEFGTRAEQRTRKWDALLEQAAADDREAPVLREPAPPPP